MGMYTELVLGVELGEPCPQQAVDMLSYMVSGAGEQPAVVPDHPLFATPRWPHMLRCGSYYFGGDTHSTLFRDTANFWTLTVRCSLKNYDDEIAKFLDWLMPFVAADRAGEFCGYWRYEEDAEPTLIYVPGGPS